MACYWIARAKINDPVAYKRYTDEVPGILKKYGGKALSRGAAFETLEGPDYFERYVIIEFESMEAAKRCFSKSRRSMAGRRSFRSPSTRWVRAGGWRWH